MDSVIVFFGAASYDQIENASIPIGFCDGTVTRENYYFFLWRYSEKEQLDEFDPSERAKLIESLGCAPASAFVVSCRQGSNARFALGLVSYLMKSNPPSVLYDNVGSFWSAQNVESCFKSNLNTDIFSLRGESGNISSSANQR